MQYSRMLRSSDEQMLSTVESEPEVASEVSIASGESQVKRCPASGDGPLQRVSQTAPWHDERKKINGVLLYAVLDIDEPANQNAWIAG